MDFDNKLRLMVVDDHIVVREGLKAILCRPPDMVVAAEAASGSEALEKFRRLRPDVTLMDLRLPDLGGWEAIRHICDENPGSRILVLTTLDGDEDIYRAFDAGARGYLLKGATEREIIDAVRAVAAGRRYVPDPIARRLAERSLRTSLTDREVEVLRLIVAGNSNKEIAWTMQVTEGTVKGHVNNLLGKMGVSDRTQAAISALQRGLVRTVPEYSFRTA